MAAYACRTACPASRQHFTGPALRLLHRGQQSRAHAKAKPEDEGQAGDQLSVAEVAEQILKDPENTARMQRVTDAAQRVAELQAESGRLAAAMAEAEVASAAGAEQREREAQASAAALIADAEVAAAEKLLQAAQLQAQSAEAAKGKWAGDINEVGTPLLQGRR